MTLQRRRFVQALLATGVAGCTTPRTPTGARVLVVGGGFGGATAARYLRRLSDDRLDVVLVEPDAAFISCPLSNLVIGGTGTIGELTRSYDALTRADGVKRVRDTVVAIDPERRFAELASGPRISYDRLVLSPGVELMYGAVEGLQRAHEDGRMVQAWKAGAETKELRAQLEAMPDGGVFAITIPEAPYRCPPGPYERACQVASYFKREKPRSKVLILDANPDVTSKAALFRKVWADDYPGIVEYRPLNKVVSVSPRDRTIGLEVQEDVKVDVVNVLPPMRAGPIAVAAGLANSNGRWCNVDFQTFASTAVPGIHVIGDAIQAAPLMPKSGHMANAQAKVAAAAIVAELNGWPVDPAPMLTNVCYSFVDATRAMHVASVHAYVAAEKTFRTVAGSGGTSSGPSALEGDYARTWARTIWADALA